VHLTAVLISERFDENKNGFNEELMKMIVCEISYKRVRESELFAPEIMIAATAEKYGIRLKNKTKYT